MKPSISNQNSQKNTDASRYHHGDLRNTLLLAAEQELTENGIEKFSLRGVAKRANVSHAAPAHHFDGATGLLTALATIGFERFLKAHLDRQALAQKDAQSQLVASGLAYIDFAMEYPALFKLMFSSNQPDKNDPVLSEAANAAYQHLVDDIQNCIGSGVGENLDVDVLAAWARVHGLADLMNAGRMTSLLEMDVEKRNALLVEIIMR